MMDASSPNTDVISMLTSGHGGYEASHTGPYSDQYGSASAGPGLDIFSEIELPGGETENWTRVPANWLDAMPADFYDRFQRDEDEISAVNSDDAGLYRMFRSLSP